MACLESIPLLMALKIVARKPAQRLNVLAATLLLPLLLVGLRGLWVGEVTASVPHALEPPRTAQSTVLSPPPTEEKPRIYLSPFFPETTGRSDY
jgi:hypothetical protein